MFPPFRFVQTVCYMSPQTILNSIHFELFFESSGDLLAITDSQGKFIKVNKIWEDIMGLNSSELEGSSILDYIQPQEFEAVQKELREFSQLPQSIPQGIVTQYRNKNDEQRFFEWKVIPFFDLYYCTARDVTARIEAENKIKKQNEELTQLLSERDKLFSIIAHDLRSPFHGLLGFSEMFTHAVKESDMQIIMKSGERLYPMVKRLYDLLENLLEWALLQRKDMQILSQNHMIRKSVDSVIGLNEEKIAEKNLEVTNNIPKDLMICADPQMINSVLRNLFFNAVKFTPRNGKIVINASRRYKFAEISLSDSGIGIPETIAKNLFTMEKEIKRKGTDGESSTGLGLILAKEYIEKNGGSIRFETEVNKGTTFYFTLPLAQ